MKDSQLAKRLLYTTDKSLPQVALLPNGLEKNLISFEIETDNFLLEAENIVWDIIQSNKEDNVMGVLQDGPILDEDGNDVPTLSVTDISGLDLVLKTMKTNFVVSFCKKGT